MPRQGRDRAPFLCVAPEGWPFILPFLVSAALLLLAGMWGLALAAFLLSLALAGFFRDPPRRLPQDLGVERGMVLSPADGTVVELAEEHEPLYLHQQARRISIFLSVFNVHINRAPRGGRVTASRHQAGRFLPAFKAQASQVNEQQHLFLETTAGPVLIKQIAGILARRIVCRAQPGAVLAAGERFGLIRFGSRVDLILPLAAQVAVRVGERVRGGESVIAYLPPPPGSEHL